MSVTNVLFMPVVLQMSCPIDLAKDLLGYIDEQSIIVLDQLIHSTAFKESFKDIEGIGVMEFEKNVPFAQVPQLLKEEGFETVSAVACVYFLSSLKGKENTDNRRAFFEGGRTLLSSHPVLINDKLQYLVIGQDQCYKTHGQRPFSIRLLTHPEIFLHSLYRVFVTKG